ncbi:Transposase and inactivated derivatives [Alysiella crassa]|uniref:Transposase and inactivated derivatives n=1 Tax=Alysiella crassa TaxID=153491 RepID=A0A376BUP9_9NEIS|nr:Transposase and inactivated derivatives [Alysiella crassa]
MAVDACGNPIEFIITAGNVNDIVVAPNLLAQLDLSHTDTVCADRGFDSDAFRELIRSEQCQANIPYKKNREHLNVNTDWYLYKIRHLVENALARLKHFRAVATRYDKLKRNYEATVSLACALVWFGLVWLKL